MINQDEIPKEIIEILKSVTNKRARVVIDHILEHGFISTETLEKHYGYNHPPRAARDVREAGIPLETFQVKSSDGRSIGAYRFADLSKIDKGKLAGRSVFPKGLKDELYHLQDGKCAISTDRYESRYLQVDHRVPYLVAGEGVGLEREAKEFMLLCGSCNRAKSWSCEHCENGIGLKDPAICKSCYWASPEEYSHIAMHKVRRADIVWTADEIVTYDKLKKIADEDGTRLPDLIREIAESYVAKRSK